MEKSETKLKQSSFKKLGWASIGLCGLCCTLPIIGTFAGISSLTAITFYMEKIGIVALALAVFLFFYSFYKKQQEKKSCTTSCDVNCDCKEQNTIKS